MECRNIIKIILGWPATGILYYLGDLTSKILNLYDKIFESKMIWAENENTGDNIWAKISYLIYKIYSKLMFYSVSINDWARLNYWKKP